MDFFVKYSGISAILVYGAILSVVLKINRSKKDSLEPSEDVHEFTRLDVNDEDATIACLVAAIDCREEFHDNVEVISVRRIA